MDSVVAVKGSLALTQGQEGPGTEGRALGVLETQDTPGKIRELAARVVKLGQMLPGRPSQATVGGCLRAWHARKSDRALP